MMDWVFIDTLDRTLVQVFVNRDTMVITFLFTRTFRGGSRICGRLGGVASGERSGGHCESMQNFLN